MTVLEALQLGIQVALSPVNLLYCMIGVTLGTAIGVLPGLGSMVAISLLLPITYSLGPEASLIMLAGIYYGSAYGGSTAAILVNLPGESSAAVVCLDGYPMSRMGRAGPALAVAAISSFVGGTIGVFIVFIGGPSLASLALSFGAPEYATLIAGALVLTATLTSTGVVKGIAMALLGILFGLVGMDVNTGIVRYTFGIRELYDGMSIIIVAIGLFAISEIIFSANSADRKAFTSNLGNIYPSRDDVKRSWKPVFRGAGLGSIIGILPGAGQTIAAFAGYMLEKNLSKDPSRFGKGAVEGVAAPEAANNAAAQTAFLPTLSLGVPGSPVMALILGALLIQGITPGPRVIVEYPALFWGLIVSMWVGNVFLIVLNLPLIGLWIKLISIPYHFLFVIVLTFSCVGAYSIAYSGVDVLLVAFFGFLGYVLVKCNANPAVFLLGFVLGPMFEEYTRRALLISSGDWSIFVSSPISITFVCLTVLAILAQLFPALRRAGKLATGSVEK